MSLFVLLRFSNFCLFLSSVVDFSNTKARGPNSGERDPFLSAERAMWFEHMV